MRIEKKYQGDESQTLILSNKLDWGADRTTTCYAQHLGKMMDLLTGEMKTYTTKRNKSVKLFSMTRLGPRIYLHIYSETPRLTGFKQWMREVIQHLTENGLRAFLKDMFDIELERYEGWGLLYSPYEINEAEVDVDITEDFKFRPISMRKQIRAILSKIHRLQEFEQYVQTNYPEYHEELFPKRWGCLTNESRDLQIRFREMLNFNHISNDTNPSEIPKLAYQRPECRRTCPEIPSLIREEFGHLIRSVSED